MVVRPEAQTLAAGRQLVPLSERSRLQLQKSAAADIRTGFSRLRLCAVADQLQTAPLQTADGFVRTMQTPAFEAAGAFEGVELLGTGGRLAGGRGGEGAGGADGVGVVGGVAGRGLEDAEDLGGVFASDAEILHRYEQFKTKLSGEIFFVVLEDG